MKLSEALQEFDLALHGEVKEKTRQWYQLLLATLPDVLGDIDVAAITASDLRRWRQDVFSRTTKYGRPYSDDSKNGHLRAVRRFFRWLKSEKLIKKNPAKKLKLIPLGDKEPKAISLDDFLTLLEKATEGGKLRNPAIILFLLGTGCRVGGLCALRLKDLDLETGRAYIHEKGRGSGKGRWLYLDEVVTHILRRYIQEERQAGESDQVFLGQRGPIGTRGIWQMLRACARDTGITTKWNPHAFRHAFAILRLMNGDNLSAVSRLLGHSNIQVTHAYYVRWTELQLQSQHRKYSPLNSMILNSVLDRE